MYHAIVLTVLALGAPPASGSQSGYSPSDQYGASQGMDSGSCDECDQCGGGHGGRHHGQSRGGVMGPMPQSCYNPSFGCYPSTRFMNRYPAFHQTYYRRPYNYRNVFDYPWHAELHEPTSYFSYHVKEEQRRGNQPTPATQPPAPVVPSPSASRGAPGGGWQNEVRQAMQSEDVAAEPRRVNPYRELRR